MSSTPPPGFGYFAIKHSVTGGTRFPTITCGFVNSGALTAAAANAALRAAMVSGTAIWDAASMSTNYTMVETYVLINDGGLLYTDTDTTAIVGTAAVACPPMNTAIVMRKNTGIAGRQYRGRCFLPPMNISETGIDQAGILSGPTITALNALMAAFHNGLIFAGISPYLLHDAPLVGATPAPTFVNSFTCTPLIGTLKRRIRV